MFLTVISCKNPVWGDEKHTSIACMVTFKELSTEVPFHAMATDPEPHGRQLWDDLLAGRYGAIGAYIAPPASPKIKVVKP